MSPELTEMLTSKENTQQMVDSNNLYTVLTPGQCSEQKRKNKISKQLTLALENRDNNVLINQVKCDKVFLYLREANINININFTTS